MIFASRRTRPGTTRLPVELVAYDAGSKVAEFWVAVPLTAGSDTTIYVWYQSASGTLTQPAATDTYGSQAVWNGSSGVGGSSNHVKFVSHDGGITDSTGNLTPVNSGTVPAHAQIGSGTHYGVGATSIKIAGDSTAVINTDNAFTWQLWAKYTATQDYGAFGELHGPSGFIWAVGNVSNSGLGGNTVYLGRRGATHAIVTSSSTYAIDNNLNAWHQHALTFNGSSQDASNYALSIDGSAVTLSNASGAGGSDNKNYLGTQGSGDSFSAVFDEERLTAANLSANYRTTDYNIQSSTSLVTVGTPGSAAIEVSATDPLTVSDANVVIRPHHVSATDALSLGHSATGLSRTKYAVVTDALAIGQTNTARESVVHLAVAENLPVFQYLALHGTQHLAATDALLVSDTTSIRDTVQRVSATDALTLSHSNTKSHGGAIVLSVTETLRLSDANRLIYPIHVAVVDALMPFTSLFNPYTGESEPVYQLLQDSSGVQKHGSNLAGDRLSFGEAAHAGVVHAGAIAASATDSISLVEHVVAGTKERDGTQAIVLGDLALAHVSKPTQDILVLGDVATVNVVRLLSATDMLVVEQSFSYVLPVTLVKREYHPYVGGGTAGNPTPPPTTLSGPESLAPGEFQLIFPATGTPTDTLVLRNPEFGNKDRLQFNRISRETHGGTLIVFADPMWPKIETLVLTFSALKPQQAFGLLNFMKNHLGLEIGLWDWEGHYWKGVITNPNDPVVEDTKDRFTAGLEFEGQLVNA